MGLAASGHHLGQLARASRLPQAESPASQKQCGQARAPHPSASALPRPIRRKRTQPEARVFESLWSRNHGDCFFLGLCHSRASPPFLCQPFPLRMTCSVWKENASKFGKLSSSHRTGKGQFSFQFQRMAMSQKCSNYCIIALISQASKVMLKIFQDRLQQYMNHELPDTQAGFRKGRGTRDQIANIRWMSRKQESSRNTSALLTLPKTLTV